MAESFLLKNIIDPSLVQKMGQSLKLSWEPFDRSGFENAIIPELEPLSLTDRARLIACQLEDFLPADFEESVNIMLSSFGPENEGTEMLGYEVFYYLPFSIYVSNRGLDHFDLSMNALFEITKRFTAEFSIRVFIEQYPEQSLQRLREWASHENPHVRRLVSEGTRPRLPWASRLPKFQKDPAPVLELLELLKTDPELYVRRSVANNLNDIAKDNPNIVVETLEKWAGVNNEGTQWIIRHASRSLLKDGHQGALKLLGYDPSVKFEVSDFEYTRKVVYGKTLIFSFRIQNMEKETTPFLIDFVVYFKKANGKLAPKVFKLSDKKLRPMEKVQLTAKHPIKPITTRSYYPGIQKLALQINGVEMEQHEFELVM